MLQGMMMVERFICHVCGKLGPGSVPGQLCGHWLHDLFWPCAVAAARWSTGKRIMLSERERESPLSLARIGKTSRAAGQLPQTVFGSVKTLGRAARPGPGGD